MEKQKLREYKGKIELIDAEERKLRELRKQIQELSFAKGPRDKQKIKDFINELAAKIRNVYKGLKADSVEGRYVADMGKAVYRLQELFAEALMDASENFQGAEAQKSTTDDGGVKYQARPSAKNPNLLDPRTVTKADVRSLLKNAETGVYDENTYIPVRISTPGIIQERLFAENLPMAMPVKKVIQAFKPDPGKIKGKNVRGHGLSVDELLHIIENLDSPDYLFSQENGRGVAVIKLSGSADNTAVFVEFGDHKNAAYMNGYEGGKYNISITAFDIDGGDVGLLMMQLDKGWTKVFDKQKEGDPAKKFQATRPFAIEQDSLNKNVAHGGEEVKPESVEAVDVEVDTKTESVAPSPLFSERTWTEAEIAEEQVEQADRDLEAEVKYSIRKDDVKKGIAVDQGATSKRAAVLAAMTSGDKVTQKKPEVKKFSLREPVEEYDGLIAVHKGYEPDWNNKHGNDVGEDGFNYFEAFFRDIDGRYYRVPFSAGLNAQEETVYSIGRIRQRSFPADTGSSSKQEALKNGRKASGDIIYSSEAKSQEVKTALQLAYERALNKKADDESLKIAKSRDGRNILTEALRGQLHMDGDAIKIALSRLQSGQGRAIGKGESIRGILRSLQRYL